MKSVSLLFLVFIISFSAKAQNMVTNGDFEDKVICPSTINNISDCTGWSDYLAGGTCDYFHTCGFSTLRIPYIAGGYQYPASGNAFGGFYNYTVFGSREYMESAISPLTTGEKYEVSMSISLHNPQPCGSDNYGIFFYKNGGPVLSSAAVIESMPQAFFGNYGVISDTQNWVRLTDTITADSAYEHIIIGAFLNAAYVTLSDPSGGFGYTLVDSVVVQRLPGARLNMQDTNFCVSQAVTLPYTVDATFFTSANVFTLQLSDASGSFANPINIGSISSNTSGSITGVIPSTTPAGTGYRLRITASDAPYTSADNGYNLRIYNTPVVKPIASHNTPVCTDSALLLHATTTTSGVNWEWKGPNGFISVLNNPVISNVQSAASGQYIVSAYINGCISRDTLHVTIVPDIAPVFTTSNSPVCEGHNINLSATTITSGVNYRWTGPGSFNSTVQNPSFIADVTHMGDYVVHAYLYGCPSIPDTVNVQVYPKPYLGNYASPNDTVCEGTVVTFVTVPMNGVTNPSFQWFKNSMAVPGETNLRFVSSYATGDTFYCRTYCQNQCGDNLTLYSNKVGMTVMPVVTNLSVTLSSVPVQALPGNPVTFTATVAGGGYNPQYQWKKNGNDIWGANYAVYSADKLSPYDEIVCCVVSSDPCAVPDTACSDAMVINFPTSVADVSNGEGIMLYPNPNNGSFKVKIQKSKIKKIEVVNVAGQVVYTTQPETAQAEYSINLPQQLPAGSYILKVNTADNIFRTSFTIVR